MDKITLATRYDDAVSRLGEKWSTWLKRVPEDVKARTQEVHLHTGSPVVLTGAGNLSFVTDKGDVTSVYRDGLPTATLETMEKAMASLCDYSIHSFQGDIQNGFITVRGGHRAGICGTAVVEKGKVSSIRDISSINLRIARQHFGAADSILHSAFAKGVKGLLLAGPPGCGKTTILRDLARQLSSGAAGCYYRVALVDERGELGGVYRGQAQNNLGPCCDCLDGYPKAQGILQALRSLAPQVIVCDEVGDDADIDAIKAGVNGGAKMIVSIHAGSLSELMDRPQCRALLNTNAFDYVAVMEGRDHPGRIQSITEAGDLLEDHRAVVFDCDGDLSGPDEIGGIWGPC